MRTRDYKYMAVLDLEATDLDPSTASIAEIGVSKIRIDTWKEVGRFEEFVALPAGVEMPAKAARITRITDAQLSRAQPLEIVWKLFLYDVMDGETCLAAYNAHYDVPLLHYACARIGASLPDVVAYDALDLARAAYGDRRSHKLEKIVADLGVGSALSHRAYHDCISTVGVMRAACKRLGIGLRQAMRAMTAVPAVGVEWYKGKEGWTWIPEDRHDSD